MKIFARISLLIGFIILFAIAFVPNQRTYGATITVTNLNNTGAGSLRDAVANSGDGDEIVFGMTGTISLTTYIEIFTDITISGPGSTNLTITSTDNASPVFIVNAIADVTMQDFRIADSTNTVFPGTTGASGGGIFYAGSLTLRNMVFQNNTATNGGALANDVFTTLYVYNSQFLNNTGGVINQGESGVAEIYDSTFIGNTGNSAVADNYDAAILEFYNSTFSGNSGPGIFNNNAEYGMFILRDSQILNNTITVANGYVVRGGAFAPTIVNYNIFSGNNGGEAVQNGGANPVTPLQIDATCNYWGADDGPSGFGPGSGEAVSDFVTFAPFIPSDVCGTLSVGVTVNNDGSIVIQQPPIQPLNTRDDVIDEYEAQGTADDAYERVLMRNGQWLVAERTLPQNLLDAGVIIAVDVYTLNGSQITNDMGGYNLICLTGLGRMIFLDATSSPRAQYEITDAYQDGLGNTCGWIPNAGTVVLIEPE